MDVTLYAECLVDPATGIELCEIAWEDECGVHTLHARLCGRQPLGRQPLRLHATRIPTPYVP